MIRFCSLSWWQWIAAGWWHQNLNKKQKSLLKEVWGFQDGLCRMFPRYLQYSFFANCSILFCFWTLPPLCFERDSKVWNLELQNAKIKLTLQRFLTEGCHTPGFWIKNYTKQKTDRYIVSSFSLHMDWRQKDHEIKSYRWCPQSCTRKNSPKLSSLQPTEGKGHTCIPSGW